MPCVDLGLAITPVGPDRIRIGGFYRDAPGAPRPFNGWPQQPGWEVQIPPPPVCPSGRLCSSLGLRALRPDPSPLDIALKIEEVFQVLLYPLSKKRKPIPVEAFIQAGKLIEPYGEWLLHEVLLIDWAVQYVFEKAVDKASIKGGEGDAPPPFLRIFLQIAEDAPRGAGFASLTYELACLRDPLPGFILRQNAPLRTILYRTSDLSLPLKDPIPFHRHKLRTFAGVASPWSHPLPTYDYYLSLQDLEKPPGRLQMCFSEESLKGMIQDPPKFDIVIVIAHGLSGPRPSDLRLLLLEDQERKLHRPVPLDDLVSFLHLSGARLVLLECCQPRGPGTQAGPGLGELLLRKVPSLAAAITFRGSLGADTAEAFLKSISVSLQKGPPFNLDECVLDARRAIPRKYPRSTNPRFDFALPSIHLRNSLSINSAEKAGYILLQDPAAKSLDGEKLRSEFERLFHSWRSQQKDPKEPAGPPPELLDQIAKAVFIPLGKAEMARYPVTCGEYDEFLRSKPEKAEKLKPSGWATGKDFQLREEDRWRPVSGLSIDDIDEYVKWLNGKDPRHQYRLPHILEWRAAAYSGGEGDTLFPWGNAWDAARVHAECPEGSRILAVEETWRNAGGFYGMLGNCWEALHLVHEGQKRVRLVGGSLFSPRWWCTPFTFLDPDLKARKPASVKLAPDIGFRLLRVPR